MTILALRDFRAGYGRSPVVHGIDLDVAAGEMVALIGPNGAGKSTLLKAVAGLAATLGGSLSLDGNDLNGFDAAARARAGAVFLPQERNIFRALTVAENLAASAWGARDLAARRAAVMSALPDLQALLPRRAGRLSGGQRQLVALGMTLMARPRVLLADEPTAGLAPRLVGEMLALLRRLAQTGIGVLLVEQNARAALAHADRAIVLVDGRAVRSGPAAALGREPDFGALFFGEAA